MFFLNLFWRKYTSAEWQPRMTSLIKTHGMPSSATCAVVVQGDPASRVNGASRKGYHVRCRYNCSCFVPPFRKGKKIRIKLCTTPTLCVYVSESLQECFSTSRCRINIDVSQQLIFIADDHQLSCRRGREETLLRQSFLNTLVLNNPFQDGAD